MTNTKPIELLADVKKQVEALGYTGDYTEVSRIQDRLSMLIKKIFGDKSSYVGKFKKIPFSPLISFSGMSNSLYASSFENGKNSVISLIDTMIEDIQLSKELEPNTTTANLNSGLDNRIFIVHGHNNEMKQAVARLTEKLGLSPIILHEQANRGRTIIEKFSDHSDVSFAIVLLSTDDIGFSVKETVAKGKFRARQNVILELGFFLGKLGRDKVVALHQTSENFEFPSDYQGVIFIPYDEQEKWKFEILRELKATGYNVDANLIL